MEFIFIRHGKTAGNCEKRYIGRTDESLCSDGIGEIGTKKFPDADLVFSSPMRRCLETAELIYGGKEITVVDDFRECDFGDFEGKNYAELNGDPLYQSWIDSGGKSAFPNGEEPEAFKRRCNLAFENIIKTLPPDSRAAFVVHGGTVMAVLEKYALPKKEFYEYNLPNIGGYITVYDGKNLKITERI